MSRQTTLAITFTALLLFVMSAGCGKKTPKVEPRFYADNCLVCCTHFDQTQAGKCIYCKASGTCTFCNGKGKRLLGKDGKSYSEACAFCQSSGKCHYCSGTGKCATCGGTGKYKPIGAPATVPETNP